MDLESTGIVLYGNENKGADQLCSYNISIFFDMLYLSFAKFVNHHFFRRNILLVFQTRLGILEWRAIPKSVLKKLFSVWPKIIVF